ncbi:MAG TPA: DMT family transporter [Candidatus Peribacteraceae bacterium]|nr:DMT family transporter [Candidatus Peribacteraceae bacterium]
MTWLLFAFSGPLLWAASTHIDKYLVEKYFKNESVAVLMVFTAIIGVLALPFIWWFDPAVFKIPMASIIVMMTSGILYMGSMYFYLQALQSEDASTVAPLFQMTGLFALVLGYLVLGERLTPIEIIGGLMVIGGSALLTIRFGRGQKHLKGRLILLMVICCFALAVSSLIFKVFAVEDLYWVTTFWNFVGEAIFGAVLMLRKVNRHRFVRLMKENTNAMIGINAANELINLGGGLGARYAFVLAPLGMVQAIMSTGPFFVLFFGVVLSLFFPHVGTEEIKATSLIQKFIAITCAVAGVVLLNQ